MDPRFKPPKPFFRYLKGEYTFIRSGYKTVSLPEDTQNELLIAAYGVTAWIKTKKGAEWAFKLAGVEEVEAHNAYKYYYNPPHGDKRRLDSEHRLRIFRRIDTQKADIYQSALDISKRVIYTEGWKLPSDEMMKITLSAYRSWLKTPSGLEWLKSIFQPILHVIALDGLAYRCTSINGEVYWMGSDSIISEPNGLIDCDACEMSFPCIETFQGIGNLCNRCYAENFAEPDILKFCNRHECRDYDCENYLSDFKLENVIREMGNLPVKWSA